MSSEQIDIEALAAKRKQQWMVGARRSMSIQDRISQSVPWWLIIIAAGLFALSAGHTAGVFNQLSTVGYAGPFVVEFALLWAAFARVNAQRDRNRISMALRGLEILAFVMAIGANGIGATTHAAMLSGIDNFSFAKIISQYGTLPITTQLVMLFVPLFAVFIPIGTWVAGEGLASLILRQQASGGALEERWRESEQEELRRTFYAEFIRQGMSMQEAKYRASALSAGMTRGATRTSTRTSEVAVLPDASQVSASVMPKPTRTLSRTGIRQSTDGSADGGTDSRAKVRQYLTDNPEAVSLSVRKLGEAAGVSKTIAAEVLNEFKAQQNGVVDQE